MTTPTTTALVLTSTAALEAGAPIALNREQVELLKRTICKGADDDELALFVATANRMGLDPFAKQIHAVKRWDGKARREIMSIQVGIDGFRVSAARTGELDGQAGPFWCGDDSKWCDVWLGEGPPAAAKVVVYRKCCAHPFTGIATYRSYVQTNREGLPNAQWTRGADYMLAKCAEAVALRKGFPERLSGAYIPEELSADDRDRDRDVAPPSAAALTPAALAGLDDTTPRSDGPPPPAAPPSLSDEQLNRFASDIRAATTWDGFRSVGVRIAESIANAAQRAMLRGFYEKQADLIEHALRMEKGA